MVTSEQQPTPWRRSSYCGTNACVEVFRDEPHGMVYVRDSKNPDIQPLMVATAAWDEFVAGVQAGEFGWPS